MKGVLLFSVTDGDGAFDERTVQLLRQDQANHSAVYHLEQIRVRVGMQEDVLSPGKTFTWDVRTDQRGEVADLPAVANVCQQLSTYLYGKVVANQDTGCAAVFISDAKPASGIALLKLSEMVSRQLSNLTPVRVHIILLQNQYAFKDANVGHLMRRLRDVDASSPAFYATLYMLPWDNEEVCESSRLTIAALVKTMMAANVDPMNLSDVDKPSWIETASILTLNAPVERITNEVFRYITDRFKNDVLVPAIHPDDVPPVTPKGLQGCISNLDDFVSEVERQHMLMPFDELLNIMPVRDPTPARKVDEDITTEKTWDKIYALYGKEKGAELRSRLSPSVDQMERQYQQLSEQLSVELLRNVIQLARTSTQNLMVSQLLSQIGDKMLSRMKDVGRAELPDYAKVPLLCAQDRKEAILKAKQRHFYLWKVYVAASKQLSEVRRQMRTDMIKSAVTRAQQYLSNCMGKLADNYSQMCAIYLSRPVERSCYDDQLAEAYDFWCSRSPAVRPPEVDELYELFTEDVLRMDIESAANAICEGLEALVKKRTMEAVDTIRVKIGSFFSELSFRIDQLTQQGIPDNLNNSLLQHLLNNQEVHSPLLYRKTAGDAMRVRARALIYYSMDAGRASDFAGLAKANDMEVVNDPHEKGVQMIVKYAGAALQDVVVYSANLNEGAEEV